ncbi:hypothetical protein tinsulaeT_03200 [Thalassotalea insulae]|uniref:histidine kinase n=1 Tax=Thalassotalea insulae TaxID=2056778 RepID=A0ABQ6GLV8_9GAMM|nr:CHASE domain-containing protein [Thalassotalea insulae]GLX76980.1 hypothetical protein tinsulaeT_03200 [Thalassotalea insulae]
MDYIRQILLLVVIAVIGGFYTYANHQAHQEKIDDAIHRALETRLSFLSRGILERLKLYQYGLIGLRGAIYAIGVNKVNYQQVEQYSNSRNYQREFPGARGIGYIRKIPPEQVEQFVMRARVERSDNTFNLGIFADHQKDRFIIQYIFPEQQNLQAIGLDIGSESMRREAALNAGKHNQAYLSAPITLVQADQKAQQGFLILLPVYLTPDVPSTPEQRLTQLVGWTYAPLLIEEILKSLPELDQNYLSIVDAPDVEPLEFYTYGHTEYTTDYFTENSIDLFGRTWKITLRANHEFIEHLNLPNRYQEMLSSVLLTLLCLLVTFIIQLMFNRRAQQAAQKIQLSQTQEKALEVANIKLEQEVAQRTDKIAEISRLQRSILNSASYAIIATNEAGIITVFNPAAEQLLGYQAQEMIGKASPAVFHLEQEVIARAQVLTKELSMPVTPGFEVFVIKAKQGKSDINQWTYVDKQGRHIAVKLSVTALFNEQEQLVGFLGIAYDLTEQLQHEAALAQAKEAAEQASQAKSDFLANMSHEIRTPMNGLFGTLQLLKEQPLNQESQDFLDKALYSTHALTTIINDILDFSKIEAGKLSLEQTIFNLEELLVHLHSDLLLSAKERGIELRFNYDIDNQYWIGDEVRIRQIFLNLIANAIKFTQQGSVTLAVSLIGEQVMRFVLTDTGIGIAPEALQRLFERFEQADSSTTRKYGGTGLGLAITRSLVRLMAGRISVTSTEGQGSVFTVEIPLKPAQAPKTSEQVEQLDFPDLTGKTILIAEDNKINQVVAAAMLKPTHAELVIANNGVEAVKQFKACSPALIFMDIQMPEMDGMQACQQIKEINAHQLVIALTANAFAADKAQFKAVFDGYLAKPLDKYQLLDILHQVSSEL